MGSHQVYLLTWRGKMLPNNTKMGWGPESEALSPTDLLAGRRIRAGVRWIQRIINWWTTISQIKTWNTKGIADFSQVYAYIYEAVLTLTLLALGEWK